MAKLPNIIINLSAKYKMRISELMQLLYIDQKKTYKEIASELSINGRTVKRLLEYSNIPIRTSSEAVSMQWENNSERRKNQSEFATKAFKKEIGNNRISMETILINCNQNDYKYIGMISKNKKITYSVQCNHCKAALRLPSIQLKNKHFCTLGGKRVNSKGESRIADYLINNDISFITQYRFNDCKGISKRLPFDFAILDKDGSIKLMIEYDGKQHYDNNTRYYSQSLVDNDRIKTQYCIDNRISLLRISYKDFNNIEELIEEYL